MLYVALLATGRITQLTRQSQEWNNTLDSMQQSRTQERLESQRIIAAKVTQSVEQYHDILHYRMNS